MLKLLGNDVYRDGEKIGWFEGNHVFAHDGRKVGYFDSQHIYDANADKVAYIEGGSLYDANGSRKADIDDVISDIEGVLPNAGKCAIYVLLGS